MTALNKNFKGVARLGIVILSAFLLASCAQVGIPGTRSVSIPTATPPLDRFKGLNEEQDPIVRVRLGKDILVPQPLEEDPLPDETVGPFELRGESLASALQLMTDDYDVTLAFESDRAMTQRVSVTNLKGKLKNVIHRTCQLADLYCHFKDGTLTVKDSETFVVDLPPLAAALSSASSSSSSSSSNSSSAASVNSNYSQIASGLQAIIGSAPTVDSTTRVMIYTATQRSQKNAEKYFERLRKNTALIIYETHIWEVGLSNENRTGINWTALLEGKGVFDFDINLAGAAPTGAADPISITPTYTGSSKLSSEAVLEFISEQGAVKTISQPQLTVLSGSSASLEVQQSENFVSGVERTPSTTPGVADSVSTTTETINTGLTMTVASAWDQSTVYGTINITLDDLLSIDEFKPDDNTTIQLPKTTKRGLQTQVRVRPGDAILIGGLVTEKDNYSGSGPGVNEPILPTARQAKTNNTELVFLLRPRVVVFEPDDSSAATPPVSDAPSAGFMPESKVRRAEDENTVPPVLETVSEDKEVDLPAVMRDASPLPEGISPEALAPIEDKAPAEDSAATLAPVNEPVHTPPASVVPSADEPAPIYMPEQKPRLLSSPVALPVPKPGSQKSAAPVISQPAEPVEIAPVAPAAVVEAPPVVPAEESESAPGQAVPDVNATGEKAGGQPDEGVKPGLRNRLRDIFTLKGGNVEKPTQGGVNP